MSQTPRTQAGLYSQLQDNDQGWITPENVRDIVASWGYDNTGPYQAIDATARKLYYRNGGVDTTVADWSAADLKNGASKPFIATARTQGLNISGGILFQSAAYNLADVGPNLTWNSGTNTLSSTNITATNLLTTANISITTLTNNTFVYVNGSGQLASITTANLSYNSTTNVFSFFSGGLTLSGTSLIIINGGGSITVSNGGSISGKIQFTNGTGASPTAFTQGSVIYAGANGYASQDNANFFWDGTNHRLGLGTATPQKTFSVGATTDTHNPLMIDSSGNTMTSGTLDVARDYTNSRSQFAVDASGNTASTGTLDVGKDFTNSYSKFQINGSGNILGNTWVVATGPPLNQAARMKNWLKWDNANGGLIIGDWNDPNDGITWNTTKQLDIFWNTADPPASGNEIAPPTYDSSFGCSSSASVRITGNREDQKPVFLEIKNLSDGDPAGIERPADDIVDLGTVHAAYVRAGIYMSVRQDTRGGQIFATCDYDNVGNTAIGNGLNIRPNTNTQDVVICAGLPISGGSGNPTLMVHNTQRVGVKTSSPADPPPQQFTVNPAYSFTVNTDGDTTTPHLLDAFGVILGANIGNACVTTNLRTLTANDGNTNIQGQTAIDWHVPNNTIMRNSSLATNNILPVTASHSPTETSIAAIWRCNDTGGSTVADSKGSNTLTIKNGDNVVVSNHWSINTRINPNEDPSTSTGTTKYCVGVGLDNLDLTANPHATTTDLGTWLIGNPPATYMARAGNTGDKSYSHKCWAIMGWAYIPSNNASCPIFLLGTATRLPPWSYTSQVFMDVTNGHPRFGFSNYSYTNSGVTLSAGWHHFCLTYGFEKWVAGTPNKAYYNTGMYVDGVMVSDPAAISSQGFPALHTDTNWIDTGSVPDDTAKIIIGNGPYGDGPVSNMLFEEWAIYTDDTHNGYDLGLYPVTNDVIASYAANPILQNNQSKQVFDPSSSRFVLGPYSATNPNGGTLSFKHPYPISGFGLKDTLTIAGGGSGYSVGDQGKLLAVVPIAPNTSGSGGFLTITTVGSGAFTAITIEHAGINYLAGTTYNVTGGSGSGFQITLPNTTATNINWDTNGNIQTLTLTSNTTFTFTNPTDSRTGATVAANFQLVLTQDATGSRLVTWPAGIKWQNGAAPTLSTTAAYVDIIEFLYDGSTYYGRCTSYH